MLFFAIQWWLTIFGGYLWPFSSYRLFSDIPEPEFWATRMRCTRWRYGRTIETAHQMVTYLHPGHFVDLEWARCSGLFKNLHQRWASWKTRLSFYKYLWNSNTTFPKIQDEVLRMENIHKYDKVEVRRVLIDRETGHILRDKLMSKIKPDKRRGFLPKTLLNKVGFGCGVLIISYFLPTRSWELDFNPQSIQTWLGLAIPLLLLFNYTTSFYRQTYLYTGPWPLLILSHLHYSSLTILGVASYLYSRNIHPETTGLIAIVLLGLWSYYTTKFSTTYSLTTTHIWWFLVGNYLQVSPLFYSLFIRSIYLQAGVSKLLSGGWRWFWYGQRIHAELHNGTQLGKYLQPYAWLMSRGTFIVELIAPFLPFAYAKWLFFGFHLGTFITMRISFWFLWIFYL